MTQYRWSGNHGRPGEWREWLTLAKLDAVAGGGNGRMDGIEMRAATQEQLDEAFNTVMERVRKKSEFAEDASASVPGRAVSGQVLVLRDGRLQWEDFTEEDARTERERINDL